MKSRRGTVMSAVVLAATAILAAALAVPGADTPPKGRRGAGGGKAGPAVQARGAGAADAAPETSVPPAGITFVRVDLRSSGPIGKKEATVWDGSLAVTGGGRLVGITSWGRDPRDIIEGNAWKISTRRSIPWNVEQRARGHDLMPLQDAALIVELADASDDTTLSFTTKQGNFSVRLADLPVGTAKPALNAMARMSRAASARTILSAPTEDDQVAAAAAPDGKIHVAYVAFAHGPDFRVREALEAEPKDLSNLAEPTGGDQVMFMTLDGGAWKGPVEITPKGGDVFRPAVAVAGDGTAWVFWGARQGDRWDLFARPVRDGAPGAVVRLTDTPGPDLLPAAATDRDGRVWVAWQAFENGQSDILAARQEGAKFGAAQKVCAAAGNQWAPAIAAAADGRIAVAWDSYERGNYDVFVRVASDGKWSDPEPAAATALTEMRPSLSFDPAGRLWLAYETAPEMWGKDWGAKDRENSNLYMGRSVAVRVRAGDRWMTTAESAEDAFAPAIRAARARAAAGAAGGAKRVNQLAQPVIACDPQGRVWLSVRNARAGTRVNVGTAWFDHLAMYDGDRWSDEILCAGTDNTLDSRPVLLPGDGGTLRLICASDGRMATAARLPEWFVREVRAKGETVQQVALNPRWPDPVNNELAMAILGPAPRPAEPKLEPVSDPPAAAPSPAAAKEARDVAAARAARAEADGRTVRLVRGEFHRHTELSQDGAGDGMLMDMWRYGLDVASQDWIGNGDHDNGGGREYSWWLTQKTTDLFHIPGAFAPMYTYERSCNYPDGHRNVMWPKRGVRTLPRLKGGAGVAMDNLPVEAERPHSPDTLLLYRYLGQFDGICASHTSGTDMGTDWRDNNTKVEPVVEIYQGCRQNYEMPGAPRANTAEDSIGGWRPYGFVSHALKRGYRLGFQSSSDHGSTHISYCNVWAEDLTSESVFAALKARHVYGATDNIVADVRCGTHFMGDEFTTKDKPTLTIRLRGTAPFSKVCIVRDGAYVHSVEPKKAEVEFQWTDFDPPKGKTAYYYVRGEQEDGELVWVSPMWIAYQP